MGSVHPLELAAGSNMAVAASVFVNANAHDYHLASGSLPIDAGVVLPAVTTDLDGTRRPLFGYWDVGAYEFAGGVP
jgi:hypothetical protein